VQEERIKTLDVLVIAVSETGTASSKRRADSLCGLGDDIDSGLWPSLVGASDAGQYHNGD
jgi:hypothetical protein